MSLHMEMLLPCGIQIRSSLLILFDLLLYHIHTIRDKSSRDSCDIRATM